MSDQERAKQDRRQTDASSSDEVIDDASVAPGATERGDRLKNELDDLLDEIDEVLETNAEEFVKSYIQKGGE
jgi:ubiquitin-like protein Pup